MNAHILAELTNEADMDFQEFMEEFEREWNARPATEVPAIDAQTEQILLEDLAHGE